MSSISKGTNRAAPVDYHRAKAVPTYADGRRWRPLVVPIHFGGTYEGRVDASRTHRRTARNDRLLGELMVGAQAGDKASYAKLLAACDTLVRRVVGHVGVQGDLVDDVVQETLITMHNARQTYDPSRSFSAWLGTIAHRCAIDALGHGGRNARRKIYESLDRERR